MDINFVFDVGAMAHARTSPVCTLYERTWTEMLRNLRDPRIG